jgi:hypothetical protein
MIKRLLVTLSIVVLLFVGSSSAVVHAKKNVPLYTFYNRISIQSWPGGMLGTRSDSWLSNPNIGNGSYSGDYVHEQCIKTQDYVGQLCVGFEKNYARFQKLYTYCYPGNDGLQHLWMFIYSSGNTDTCYSLNGSGHYVGATTQLYLYDCANSTKECIQTYNTSDTPLPCWNVCTLATHPPAWYWIQWIESINANVSGHTSWGNDWHNGLWEDFSGVLHSIQVDGSMTVGNPPQFYWHSRPSQSPGGHLYYCVYESGTTCTLGG